MNNQLFVSGQRAWSAILLLGIFFRCEFEARLSLSVASAQNAKLWKHWQRVYVRPDIDARTKHSFVRKCIQFIHYLFANSQKAPIRRPSTVDSCDSCVSLDHFLFSRQFRLCIDWHRMRLTWHHLYTAHLIVVTHTSAGATRMEATENHKISIWWRW